MVTVEERCRKMEEIIKHRLTEYKKVKMHVSLDDIAELESNYEEMIFSKEEN